MTKLLISLVRASLLALLLLAGAGAGVHWYQVGPRWVTTENAYVKTDMIAISSEVDGRIVEVAVADNQSVAADALLFSIDPEPLQIELAEAEAALTKAEQQVEAYRAQHRLAELEVAQAEERVAYLEVQFERQEKLKADGTGTQVQHDAAAHDVEMARHAVALIRQRSRLTLTDLVGDPQIPVDAHPLVLEAAARRDQIARDLTRVEVRAPAAGNASMVRLAQGEYVEEGDTLFFLVTDNEPWIQVNLKESKLTHVRVGQRASAVLDAYPDFQWDAWVESISPATGAEFAVLPPQNASGNWVKVVQRVPIRLRVRNAPGAPRLRAGMTAMVRIDTERERDAYVLFQDMLGSATAKDERDDR